MQARPLPFTSCLSESDTEILMPRRTQPEPHDISHRQNMGPCPEISQWKGNFSAGRTACATCTHSGCFSPGVTVDDSALVKSRVGSEGHQQGLSHWQEWQGDSTGANFHGSAETAESPGSLGKLVIPVRVEFWHTFAIPVWKLRRVPSSSLYQFSSWMLISCWVPHC